MIGRYQTIFEEQEVFEVSARVLSLIQHTNMTK